jgi:hypothetical protein
MQRDQFKEKIIKWPNYYYNEYYIIKLSTKNSNNSKYVNLPIFSSQKYDQFWIFFTIRKRQNWNKFLNSY